MANEEGWGWAGSKAFMRLRLCGRQSFFGHVYYLAFGDEKISGKIASVANLLRGIPKVTTV